MRVRLPNMASRWLAYFLLLCVALSSAGCLAVVAGAAGGAAIGYAYLKGRVYETYNANFDDSWGATQTALKELGMPILNEERKADGGFMESKTADHETVRIYVDAVPSNIPAEPVLSRVSVRVATFGDKQFSNRLLDQVGLHLVPAGVALQPVAAQPASQGVVQTAAPALAAPSSPGSAGMQQTVPPPLLPSEPVPIKK